MLNVEVVTSFADESVANEVDRDTVALQHENQVRERFPAVQTKYAGPSNGTGNTGVSHRVADPDAAGSPPGSASNCAVHAFCSVSSGPAAVLVGSTLTLAMFACRTRNARAGRHLRRQARARWSGVVADVDAVNDALNAEDGAVGDLEGDRQRHGGAFRAAEAPRELHGLQSSG